MSANIFGFRGDPTAVQRAASELASKMASLDKTIRVTEHRTRNPDGTVTIAYKFVKEGAPFDVADGGRVDDLKEELREWVSDIDRRNVTIIARDLLRNRMEG